MYKEIKARPGKIVISRQIEWRRIPGIRGEVVTFYE